MKINVRIRASSFPDEGEVTDELEGNNNHCLLLLKGLEDEFSKVKEFAGCSQAFNHKKVHAM